MDSVTTLRTNVRATTRSSGFDAFSVALVLLAVVTFAARVSWQIADRPITSDESLYLAEAVAIADGRVEYPSGAPIVHRPPLYPATLAPLMKISGNNVDFARLAPMLYGAGALLTLYALASVAFGGRAAAAGVCLAAFAAYPAKTSTAFFVDTPSAMWLFASCATWLLALRSPKPLRGIVIAAASGTLLGLAFLTKETAAAWLPFAIVLALASSKRVEPRSIVSFYAAFAVVAAPWFVWVALHGDGLFKLDAGTTIVAGAMTIAFAATVGASMKRGLFRSAAARRAVAALVLAAWCALMLFVLESRPEPQPIDYLHTVPRWMWNVFAHGVEPSPLIAVAWLYVAWRAWRGHDGARAIVAAAVCALPLVVYAANRDWELRQAMPLVYLSYAVLGWASLSAIDAAARSWAAAERHALAACCIVAVALVAGYASDLGPRESSASANWHDAREQEIAGWLDALPRQSVVLSTRQYYAQLFVDTDGALTIRQLPTLGVTVRSSSGVVRPFGTLFRYEDASTDLTAPRTWMYFRKYEDRPYAIALSEDDLLASIRLHNAHYVLLTGEDAGFSTLAYRDYFDRNPAFTKVRAAADGDAALYAVDSSVLAPAQPPLRMTTDDLVYLIKQAGTAAAAPDYWRTIAPNGVRLDGTQSLESADLADLASQLHAP